MKVRACDLARRPGDNELLALIRRLVDERPTYGYRRIRRLINRQRKANGKPPVNGKRVLRIMQANKLTLERHTGRRPGRTHDGVVIALRSNIRWCSDHFELACRNGEIVRVLFAIDACDREVMGWLATSAGISGEMVRDLMVACVERHSGSARRRIPSNGCPTTARRTSPRTRSTPQRPWASSFVSRQSAGQRPSPECCAPDQGSREARALPSERQARTRLDHARQSLLQVGRAVWHRRAVCPPLWSREVVHVATEKLIAPPTVLRL